MSVRARVRLLANPWVVAEATLLAVAIVLAFAVGSLAEHAWLARANALSNVRLPPLDEVASLGRRARALFALGVAFLLAGRLVASARNRDAIRVPWLVPAMVYACLLGLVVHSATVEVVQRAIDGHRHAVVLLPTAAAFAEGFALGAFAAFAVMVSPLDPVTIAVRLRVPIAASIVAIFVALALVGHGPEGSGTRINLGPIQPIEAVKVLLVLFLAAYLGARAPKLRWQRRRFLGLSWPRPRLLVPALLGLVGIFAGLYVVGDLGPVSILAFVFLGMFYVATRASGWVASALATVVGLVALASARSELVSVGRVVTRIRMWRDPFWNGIAYGNQLGEGLWAIAAGGPFGQGLGEAHTPLVSAGKTDLVLATLAEELGAVSVLAYVALLLAIAMSGFHVASRTRTAERVLLAAGASLLLVVQWFVIHGGTYGTIPLTGVVVPFLSAGRTSLVAFAALVGVVARIAEDGPPRTTTPDLEELHTAVRSVAAVALLLAFAGGTSAVRVGIVEREAISATPISTRLGDGSLTLRSNPRLLALAKSLRRGTIADREGRPLATTEAGHRTYPLGSALGTLLGIHPSRVLLPPWSLERVLDTRLRGYGERDDGPTGRAYADLRRFAPLLSLPRVARERRVRSLDADVASRSVRLSIDAPLQRRIAEILTRHATAEHRLAIAAAVIDVDDGRVLARVQVPDFDPNDAAWQDRLAHADPELARRFTAAYGPWPDKTGIRGFFQSGSIGKLFTALAAARRGWRVRGTGCGARPDVEFECAARDAQGPYFTRPGWPRPIHDHSADPMHGHVDLIEAIGVSCNVYFGQLALAIGPEPFVDLERAGVDVGYGGRRAFDPGAPGSRQLASTGFGQGALVMNVVQAARLTAAIGAGGRYRACAATMDLATPCTETSLVADPRDVEPILAGMRRVLTSGTGRALHEPEGLRIYGKTGTADVRGFAGEEPFGIARGADAAPHSWFVALAEPEAEAECGADVRGRLAVAVVVPRGGSGASAAGPIVMQILDAARSLGFFARR